MPMRLTLGSYSLGSTLLTAAVVASSAYQRQQLYPTLLHLSTSNSCLLVLGNQALLLLILAGHALTRLFLGSLRDEETEYMSERFWVTITDTLLVMTIFRDEFNMAFVCCFSLFTFLRVFHWLCDKRIDLCEVHTIETLGERLRLGGMMALLLVADLAFLYVSFESVRTQGASMMILFGFESALLLLLLGFSAGKYLISAHDIATEYKWERKGDWLLHLRLVVDAIKLTVYLLFFTVIFTYYGLPLHIIRQLHSTFRSFRESLLAVVKYRRVTANFDIRFPEMTPEEIAALFDQTCIYCREDMESARRLPCGRHALHAHCLRRWLQQQQVCPSCHLSVVVEELAADHVAAHEFRARQQAAGLLPPNAVGAGAGAAAAAGAGAAAVIPPGAWPLPPQPPVPGPNHLYPFQQFQQQFAQAVAAQHRAASPAPSVSTTVPANASSQASLYDALAQVEALQAQLFFMEQQVSGIHSTLTQALAAPPVAAVSTTVPAVTPLPTAAPTVVAPVPASPVAVSAATLPNSAPRLSHGLASAGVQERPAPIGRAGLAVSAPVLSERDLHQSSGELQLGQSSDDASEADSERLRQIRLRRFQSSSSAVALSKSTGEEAK